MAKSRKSLRTERNYSRVNNFIKMGCSTSEISKFMNLTYNQAWYLRKDVVNRNQREALEKSNVDKMVNAKPTVKARVTSKPKVSNIQPEKVQVSNDGKSITITINLAI